MTAEIALTFVTGVLFVALTAVLSLLWNLAWRRRRLRRVRVGEADVELDPDDVEKSMAALKCAVRGALDRPRVFVIHSFSDREFAKRLAEGLRSRGIPTFLPEEELVPGDFILKAIQQVIDTSDWVLIVISPSSMGSNWVGAELKYALDSEMPRGRPFVIPIVFGSSDVPAELRGKVYADFRASYYTGLESVVAAVKRRRWVDSAGSSDVPAECPLPPAEARESSV